MNLEKYARASYRAAHTVTPSFDDPIFEITLIIESAIKDSQGSRMSLSEIADRHAAEFLDATDPRGGDMYPVIRAAITDAVLDAWGEYA